MWRETGRIVIKLQERGSWISNIHVKGVRKGSLRGREEGWV
jgi:hypothetical protein